MNGTTIKGIFVNSHIRAVRKKLGDEGVSRLEELFGKTLKFKNSEDVPVADEVRIIDCALLLLSEQPVPESSKDFEAGRLHFRNFSSTPLAHIIFSLFRKNFKLMMMQSHNIAGHVFHGAKFTSEELSPSSVRVTVADSEYPLDHFKGLFQEWMNFAGLQGTVVARRSANQSEYTMSWQ